MNIRVIKTNVIYPSKESLIDLIDSYVTDIEEQTIIAISSKIVSLCEGSVFDPVKTAKDSVIKQSAELYQDRVSSKYNSMLTITHNTLMLAAGVDESNSDGMLVTWPINPLLSAQAVADFMKKKFNINDIGIVIVDSTSRPLRIGSIGTSLAHTGFQELNDYIGTNDLFGRTMTVSQANVAECIATAAVLAMGEGAEQTPMALFSNIENIVFDANAYGTCYQKNRSFIADDIYASLLTSVKWQSDKT